ncbi:MAG: hypothetical protein ACI915_002523 [Gammaproteobacteria bacterium]|jgi:hypothetical protein
MVYCCFVYLNSFHRGVGGREFIAVSSDFVIDAPLRSAFCGVIPILKHPKMIYLR